MIKGAPLTGTVPPFACAVAVEDHCGNLQLSDE